MIARPLVALVDPIRVAKAFLSELDRRGVNYVVVESGYVGDISTGQPRAVPAASTVQAMAGALRKLGVTHLIGCVDPSITYADRLAAELGLLSNGLRLSEARRNKAQMIEVVRSANLRVPAQFEITDGDAMRVWARSAAFPAVVKPAASGGTDNVYLCHSADEAVARFEAMFGARNLMGAINTTVLAQEYVDGIEYVVDCVSFSGEHVPIDLFEYQKGTHNGRAFIYEKERYLPSDHSLANRLIAFASAALDALEFRVGASHMELKINSAGEVVFIEVGPRLNGGDIHLLVREARADGKSQVEYAIDTHLSAPAPDPAYRTAKHAVRVHVVSTVEGTLARWEGLDEIRMLPSFSRMSLHVEPGGTVVRTTDLTNHAGWIDLADPDLDVLRADEGQLDAILRKGVLVLE